MLVEKIPLHATSGGLLHVVVETPRASQKL